MLGAESHIGTYHVRGQQLETATRSAPWHFLCLMRAASDVRAKCGLPNRGNLPTKGAKLAMKKIFLIAVGCLCTLALLAHGQVLSELSMPPNGDNQRAEISQWIGLVKISIEYHSPNVHGGGGADRSGHIWGELVGYGFFDEGFGPSHATPWRAGANESTTISVSHDVKVEGKELKAGTYALFLDVE